MQSARDALNKKIKVGTQTIKEKVSKDAAKTQEPPEFLRLQQQLKLTRTTVRWLKDLSKPIFSLKPSDANPIVQFNREVQYGEKARQAYQTDRRHMDSLEVEKDKTDVTRQKFEEAKTTYGERKESFTATAHALLRRRDEQYRSTIDGMMRILRSTHPKWHVAKTRAESVMVSPGAFITASEEQGPVRNYCCGCQFEDEGGPVNKFCEFHEETNYMKLLSQAYVSRKDDELEGKLPPDFLRFEIYKFNKMGVKKMRHIQLMVKELALRSFEEGSHKDYPFADITAFEKSIEDDLVFTITLQSSRKVTFHFSTAAARIQFLAIFFWMRDLQRTALVTGCNVLPHPLNRLTLFTGTWNIGQGAAAAQNLSQWLPDTNFDIYAIAFQECGTKEREAWQSKIKAHILHQSWEKGKGAKSPSSAKGSEEKEDESYVTLGWPVLWECSLWVMIKKDHLHRVSAVQSATVACGVGGVLGNKGGAGLSFRVDDTSLCFVGAHLAARGERVVERQQNHIKILKELGFGEKNVPLIHQFDHVFFLGDLNYRVELTFEEAKNSVAKKDYQSLLDSDQLLNERRLDNVFVGFDEGHIGFAPTYRWEKQKNEFSDKRGQPPSYTDRVLWHSRDRTMLRQTRYDSAPDIFGSDHRAVYATFALLRQPIASPFAIVKKQCQIRAQKLQIHLFSPLPEAFVSTVLTFRSSLIDRKDNCRTELGVRAIEQERLEWQFHERVQWTTTVADATSVAHNSIFISVNGVKASDPLHSAHRLGSSSISLFPLVQATSASAPKRLTNSYQFMVNILHDGKACGQLTGLLEILFSGTELKGLASSPSTMRLPPPEPSKHAKPPLPPPPTAPEAEK